jgi:cell division septation protein DedD
MNKRKALLERSNAIRSVLKALRKKKASKTPFLNEDGAVDTSSIMIAVIVLGLLAGLIASTVFVVIPWAQDNAAKQQLKSIMAAQQVYAGMATLEQVSPDNNPSGSLGLLHRSVLVKTETNDPAAYGTLSDLIKADLFDPDFLPVDADDLIYGEQVLSPDRSLCVIKVENGKGYEAAVRSTSGHIFVTNDGWVGPIQIPDTEPICRGRVLGDYSEYENKVSNPQPSPTATAIISPSPDEEDGTGEETIVTEPVFTPTPEPTPSETVVPVPTVTPTASATPVVTPTPSVTPSTSAPTPTPTSTPVAPKPEPIPDAPARNKDPKTKTFMFCHMGAMHSNSFNGMVNGHQGHDEDIMPPIPPRNYVGWNWNAQTAKIYYNNCKPL